MGSPLALQTLFGLGRASEFETRGFISSCLSSGPIESTSSKSTRWPAAVWSFPINYKTLIPRRLSNAFMPITPFKHRSLAVPFAMPLKSMFNLVKCGQSFARALNALVTSRLENLRVSSFRYTKREGADSMNQ